MNKERLRNKFEASIIISPDKSEPRALTSGFPLHNGHGSDSSGKTMTEANFDNPHPDCQSYFGNILKGKSYLKGFTLLELLIALTIFAILASITSSSLYNSFKIDKHLSVQSLNLSALQFAQTTLQHDTESIALRATRDKNMLLSPVFIGEPAYLEFTRGGITNPNSIEKRSNMQRLALICRSNKLIRRRMLSLDSSNSQLFTEKTLLTKLAKCQFKYLDKTLQFLSNWDNTNTDAYNIEQIPKAIQLNLEFKNKQEINFLFILPPGLYA